MIRVERFKFIFSFVKAFIMFTLDMLNLPARPRALKIEHGARLGIKFCVGVESFLLGKEKS